MPVTRASAIPFDGLPPSAPGPPTAGPHSSTEELAAPWAIPRIQHTHARNEAETSEGPKATIPNIWGFVQASIANPGGGSMDPMSRGGRRQSRSTIDCLAEARRRLGTANRFAIELASQSTNERDHPNWRRPTASERRVRTSGRSSQDVG